MTRELQTIAANAFDRQWLEVGEDVLQAVARVGSSGWYVLGSEVERFESDFAREAGAAHAIGCGNGLDAIEIALRALGLEAGDRVLTTPLSAFATTLAIVRAGGVPVFIDVDASGLLDLDAAEKCLADDPRIRFAVPVHLFGHALDLRRLTELRDRFELRIVEDAAQAVSARSGELRIGSVGQATTLSFYPTKNLGALGDGGCVLTNDHQVADTCRTLRDYGQSAKYVHSRLGLNSRLDELQAAVLRSAMLPRLAGWTERRRAIAARYREALANCAVDCPNPPEGSESVWHLFPVLVPDGTRDAFVGYMQSNAVQTAIHYPRLIPEQQALAQRDATTFGSLTNAKRYSENEVSLPVHPYLRDDEVLHVTRTVAEWKP